MALVLKDRVRETTAVIGTNDATLLGAVNGFQAFSAVGNGNTCYYTISDQAGANWEVGIGTYNSVGPTLTRDTVLASSNSDSKVNFPSGTKDVFLTYPSERAVYLDADGNLDIEGAVVINANTSSDAVRITQIGAGNALVVEDSANPDSTPFVVDASGNVVIGATASQFNFPLEIYTTTSKGIVFKESSADTASNAFYFRKSRGTTPTSLDIVANGDGLGAIYFQGTDGVNGLNAAGISAGVDGTPGTNDMPGRLVFSTTADGASNTTERMRIDSTGRIGVGGSGSINSNAIFTIGGVAISGTDYGYLSNRTAGSGTTTQLSGFNTSLSTSAASFTLGNMYHFAAQYQGIGAGSTVTNQIGFYASNALTGATNNYGFYSGIASGTGRWNFYASGSAKNYFAGDVGIGALNPDSFGKLAVVGGQAATSSSSAAFVTPGSGQGERADLSLYGTFQNTADNGPRRTADIIAGFNAGAWGTEYLSFNVGNGGASNDGRVVTSEKMRITSTGNVGVGYAGSTYAKFGISATATPSYGLSYGYYNTTTISSGLSVTDYRGFYSEITTAAASWNLPTLVHFMAGPQVFGAGSTVNNQFGFYAASTLTGATNNYGLYSAIAAGSGRYNLYVGGSADNYMAGRLGLGSASLTSISFRNSLNMSGSVSSSGMVVDSIIQSDVTSDGTYYTAYAQTVAAAFTLTNMRQFYARQGTLGAGSAVTNQYGFATENSLTGATNNFGFFSNIASGTGRWNFYAGGSANNYMAGRLGVGGLGNFVNLHVAKTITGSAFSIGVLSDGTVQPDVTSRADLFLAAVNTQPTAFTAGRIVGYKAQLGTIGAGSTVSNAAAFEVDGNWTGATNNFGLYSAIAAGSGRWNLYAGGTAENYFAGNTTFGSTSRGNSLVTANSNIAFEARNAGTAYYQMYNSSAGADLKYWRFGNSGGNLLIETVNDAYSAATERMRVSSGGNVTIGGYATSDTSLGVIKSITGATSAYGIRCLSTINSDVTSSVGVIQGIPSTQAASFTVGSLLVFDASFNTKGAGSSITSLYGFVASSGLNVATNNYGFYGSIAAGTGRYNFYAAGTADNYFAGNVGIGGTANMANGLLSISKPLTGATTGFAVAALPQILSDVTVSGGMFATYPSTAAAAFTLPTLTHFQAAQGTIGAGSTVTNQYGYIAGGSLTGATNNYGFYSQIASGTGRYNFYAAGTADNYFAGNVGVGVSPTGAASSKLFIAGDITLTNTNTVLFSNLYYSGGFKYVGNGYGSLIKLNSPSNAFEFFYAGNNSSGAGAAATAVAGFVVDYNGNVLVTGSGGLGYGTGSGGAVTQTTSRTQGVTLNKTNGAITLVSAAGSATFQSFTVTNSTVAATDTIIINQKSGTDLYEIHITAVAAGSFRVSFKTTGGTTTEQPVFNFAVIKAVTA